jgi:hypothetical protein
VSNRNGATLVSRKRGRLADRNLPPAKRVNGLTDRPLPPCDTVGFETPRTLPERGVSIAKIFVEALEARRIFVMRPLVRRWTDEEIAQLKLLVRQGASAARAAVVLKRQTNSVRRRAWELGLPFPSMRRVRRTD